MMETPDPESSATPDDGVSDGVSDGAAIEDVIIEEVVIEGVITDDDATAADETASPVGTVLQQVKERGFITTGEIFAAFPDLEPDTDELRDLWDMFESRGIKVLDEIAEELKLEDERRGVSQSAAESEAPARRRPEHRPSAASRPGTTTRRTTSYDEPDEELQAVRSAARPTHSEGGGS